MSPRTPNVVLSVGDNYELTTSLIDDGKWLNLAIKERWSAPGAQRKVHDAAYPVEQLQKVLGGCCAQPSAHCEATAELRQRVQTAEAKLAKVIAELERSVADDLTIKTYNRLHRAATEGYAAFTLPTEPGSRFEAVYHEGVMGMAGRSEVFTTLTGLAEPRYVADGDATIIYTAAEVMTDFTSHRILDNNGAGPVTAEDLEGLDSSDIEADR